MFGDTLTICTAHLADRTYGLVVRRRESPSGNRLTPRGSNPFSLWELWERVRVRGIE
jgi:hypothetical protein